MTWKLCENGHGYDPAKNITCPHCGIPDLDVKTTKHMQPTDGSISMPAPGPDRKSAGIPTRPYQNAHPVNRSAQPNTPDDPATIRILDERLGFDPVVGWLVCIEGPDRGRDYRIKSEKNAIGRAENMDICIRGDNTVSKEKHAFVSCNPENYLFKLIPGESRGLVYLNGDDVDMPTLLNPYDVIRLGKTKLLFIPLCGEKFHWE
jgi:hypothetical protein